MAIFNNPPPHHRPFHECVAIVTTSWRRAEKEVGGGNESWCRPGEWKWQFPRQQQLQAQKSHDNDDVDGNEKIIYPHVSTSGPATPTQKPHAQTEFLALSLDLNRVRIAANRLLNLNPKSSTNPGDRNRSFCRHHHHHLPIIVIIQIVFIIAANPHHDHHHRNTHCGGH